MKKKKGIIFLIIALLLAGGLAYYLWQKKKSDASDDAPNPAQQPVPLGTSAFPLKKGSNNSYVKELQKWINKQTDTVFMKPVYVVPNYPLATDGIWGSKTDAA